MTNSDYDHFGTGDFLCADDDCREREPDGMYELGCLFPGECLMPGVHMRAECHTIDHVHDWETLSFDDAALGSPTADEVYTLPVEEAPTGFEEWQDPNGGES